MTHYLSPKIGLNSPQSRKIKKSYLIRFGKYKLFRNLSVFSDSNELSAKLRWIKFWKGFRNKTEFSNPTKSEPKKLKISKFFGKLSKFRLFNFGVLINDSDAVF